MRNIMIDFLLKNANPSIKRRVKDEILHELTSAEATEYQAQLREKPNVRCCAACCGFTRGC